MPLFDLTPATDRLAALVAAVPDEALTGPTPCPDMRVGALLDHIAGLSIAFTHAATKEPLPDLVGAPSSDASTLVDDWRTVIPERLAGLAAAWQADAAWEGQTMAGPVETDGPTAAAIALDEVVVHGWDLAAATGQDFAVEPGLLPVVAGFVGSFGDERPPGLFGPRVTPPADATELEAVIAETGRDPRWAPPAP